MKANKGAPGIDGMTVEAFPAFAREHWPRIARALMEGTYRPAPVRRSWIPKPDGSKRPFFIVMVKSAKAAQRVMGSLIRYCEGRLKLVINRAKSRTAPLKSCAFLGYQIGSRGKLEWTPKAMARFKQRVREWERSGHRQPGGLPGG